MTYDKAELVALDKKYVWHHLTQHKNFEPAIYVKGEGMRITDIDGVKIDFKDSWVHLRKSNTEPIIRIYAEAATMEKAEALAEAVKQQLIEAC